MNTLDLRELLAELAAPMAMAEACWRTLLKGSGHPLQDAGTVVTRETPDARERTLSALVACLKLIERNAEHNDVDLASPSSDDRVVELLAISSALYFNGTPRPNVWQTIIDIIDRNGSWPTSALTFKLYGDTYRIERRHWEQYRDNDHSDDEATSPGIVSVAEFPMVAMDEQALALSDDTSLLCGDADGRWLRASSLPDILNGCSDNALRPLMYSVTERLARLYSAIQVLAYVSSGHPLRMIWRDKLDNRVGPSEQAALGNRLSARQYVIKVSANHNPAVKALPYCVLSSVNFGVIRDPGQLLRSSAGRSELSGRHVHYRADVLKCFEGLSREPMVNGFGGTSAYDVVVRVDLL